MTVYANGWRAFGQPIEMIGSHLVVIAGRFFFIQLYHFLVVSNDRTSFPLLRWTFLGLDVFLALSGLIRTHVRHRCVLSYFVGWFVLGVFGCSYLGREGFGLGH